MNQVEMKSKKRITVVLVDRANYGRLKPVMKEINSSAEFELSIVCAGTMVLDRFDRPSNIVRNDGFTVDSEIHVELEGSNPTTMSKSLGFSIIEFTGELTRLNPDFVLLIGDRYEALGAALAASYMNMCLIHIQGGEVSGSIDESARHCISKLAHYHFPSTVRSAEFLVRMGEDSESVFMVGCPSSDIARSIDLELPADIFDDGIGCNIDLTKPYMLVVFHPVTTSYGAQMDQVQTLAEVFDKLNMQVVWLWPNIDAGSDHVSRAIRRFRESNNPKWLRLMKNFTPENYLRVLGNAKCAVGNSSSFVRDSSFFGTPVVLIGDRQIGREYAENVRPVDYDGMQIENEITYQITRGPYPVSTLYGDGKVAERIVSYLRRLTPKVQKHLSYIK